MLVERVSGMTLQAFCRKEFFEPLGMAATQWRDDFRRIVPNRAIAYSLRSSEWRQDMPFEDIYGNGGLLTTVGDLLKWNRNLASCKLYPSLFELMQKPSALTDGKPVQYGFGFFLFDFETLRAVSHSGATAGYRAWLGRIPAKGLSVAILCNAGSADTTDQAKQIIRLYLGLAKPDPPVPPKDAKPGLYRSVRDHSTLKVENTNGKLTFDGEPVQTQVRFSGDKMFVSNLVYGEDIWEHLEPAKSADLSAFPGLYYSDEAEVTLRVTLENGELVLHRRPASSFELKPTYADAFDCDLGSIHFVRDTAGKVAAFSLGEGRVWDLQFTRQDK